MKKLIFTFANLLIITSLWAQTPEKMSYQAVIRDAEQNLLTNQTVGMQISILQGDAFGEAVYVETQSAATNANGLLSIEIGSENATVIKGTFSSIDWSTGPYFIKTETDPSGGTNYTLTGTNQLLSVPYALHAKTAETVTGSAPETDPIFSAWDKSSGISITENQINDLGAYIETETDPVFESSVAKGITSVDTANWNAASIGNFNETDPVFEDSEAANITATDITNLGNLSGTNTGDQDISGITTNATAISENEQALQDTAVQIRNDIPTNNNQLTNGAGYLKDENDPSVPSGTQTGEMQYWDGEQWITVSPGNEGQILTFVNGKPTWKSKSDIIEVTNPVTGKTWMNKNLGAWQAATSSNDPDAYGDLFQWGRAADGHEERTSKTTATLSNSDKPGHGDFITSGSNPDDWRSPQNDNLWQGISGTNNPCPSLYRLPTQAEWEAERATWSSDDAAGAFASPLKLPMAGYRKGDGTLLDVGYQGSYWSNTVNGVYSVYLLIDSNKTTIFSYYRAGGFSVRCIKDFLF